MREVHQSVKAPFPADKLYHLVADIERYPAFIPWCRQVRILRQTPEHCDARVVVGFPGIRQSYLCRVHWKTPEDNPEQERCIEVEYLSGPLTDLFTRWRFVPLSDNSCQVDFYLNFALRRSLLSGLVDRVMLTAVGKMTDAFLTRAEQLYGTA